MSKEPTKTFDTNGGNPPDEKTIKNRQTAFNNIFKKAAIIFGAMAATGAAASVFSHWQTAQAEGTKEPDGLDLDPLNKAGQEEEKPDGKNVPPENKTQEQAKDGPEFDGVETIPAPPPQDAPPPVEEQVVYADLPPENPEIVIFSEADGVDWQQALIMVRNEYGPGTLIEYCGEIRSSYLESEIILGLNNPETADAFVNYIQNNEIPGFVLPENITPDNPDEVIIPENNKIDVDVLPVVESPYQNLVSEVRCYFNDNYNEYSLFEQDGQIVVYMDVDHDANGIPETPIGTITFDEFGEFAGLAPYQGTIEIIYSPIANNPYDDYINTLPAEELDTNGMLIPETNTEGTISMETVNYDTNQETLPSSVVLECPVEELPPISDAIEMNNAGEFVMNADAVLPPVEVGPVDITEPDSPAVYTGTEPDNYPIVDHPTDVTGGLTPPDDNTINEI